MAIGVPGKRTKKGRQIDQDKLYNVKNFRAGSNLEVRHQLSAENNAKI